MAELVSPGLRNRVRPPHVHPGPDSKEHRISPRTHFRSIGTAAIISVTVLSAYLANGRYVGSGDCVPAIYVPIALAWGDGPWLDRFETVLAGPDGRLPGYCEKSRGHIVSRYPIGPGLLLAPLVAPQVWILDAIRPGWDRSPETFRMTARRISKNASALLAAISMVMLWIYLRSMFGDSAATFGTLAAALGSGMWSTASQAPWQHGPAVFCLCLVLILIKFGRDDRWTGALTGIFASMIVVCRTVDLPIAGAIAVFVLRRKPGMRIAFLISATAVALLWSSWNVYFFDHMTGGYAEIEKMHGWAHGVQGSWSTPLATGMAGTFLSPSHGLIVYCPWVLVILALPLSIRQITDPGDRRLAIVLAVSLVPTTIMLSKYGCWWAGHCFGPRFWIDSTPIFALFAAGFWASARSLRRLPRVVSKSLLAGGVIWAASLQAVAVVTYPTTWHSVPTNADRDHERLWDFEDNEVTRGLREGPRPREWNGLF
jgi:hypothetical protein